MPNFAFADPVVSLFMCASEVCQNRRFKDLNALYDHCRNAGYHAGEWCEKCKRLFVSPAALQQHKITSNDHNACRFCPNAQEFDHPWHLQTHEWSEHGWCRRCSRFYAVVTGSLIDHEASAHHICAVCEKQCDSQHNLQQVLSLFYYPVNDGPVEFG